MRLRVSRRPLARLIPGLLALSLAATTPGAWTTAAPAASVVVQADTERVRVFSPFLHLEFDLRQPAFDVVRVAPRGDRQYGGSVGFIADEVSLAGQRLRSYEADGDGARAAYLYEGGTVRLRIEGIDVGSATSSVWMLSVPPDGASVQLERLTRARVNAEFQSQGLAIVSPTVPEGANPASVAWMLNEGTYRNEVAPDGIERSGWMLGRLAVDHNELSFSARTDQPDRVAARPEDSWTSLAFARGLPGGSDGYLRETITLRFGWNNDYLPVRSDVAPEVERRLLAAGYHGNAVISPVLGTVLSASMRDYRGSVWSRDSDYALQGYAYVLDDLTVFRNNLQRFLERLDSRGVAPEFILLDGQYGNRQAWDSMANVIQTTHTYVARTGDLNFYREHEQALKRALGWIRALDTDGDGLPDRDIFPYGYTDTVENGPMHTYAIAKHYAAYLAMAELEEAAGRDGRPYRAYARAMRAGFKRPLAAGGYWNPERGHPIAWKRANGRVYNDFETFGIFEAIRVGLLDDPAQLQSIGAWLDANRGAFLNSNSYPERLMIGGYDLSTRKAEVPLEKLWIMDCNAPWITGISVPARVMLGRLDDAREMLSIYVNSANRSIPHAEFGAGPNGAYGPGETQDGGRLWDNWSWFQAVYGTHFGLRMTIPALEIAPAPLDALVGRQLNDVTYQGARVQLALFDGGYYLNLSEPRKVILRPPYGFQRIDVDDQGDYRPSHTFTTAANTWYTIRAAR